jgi:hypothetical protein
MSRNRIITHAATVPFHAMRKCHATITAIAMMTALICGKSSMAHSQPATSAPSSAQSDPLDAETLSQINQLYHRLIDAENRHNIAEVRTMLWDSPSALFVAKTATRAEGNWAGFWGAGVVLQHLADLYSGVFVMAPDYDRVKSVGLSADVALTYAPLNISVAYAGQTPTPKPFLMIVNWVRTSAGWKMATDIALPIPPPPNQ